MMQADAQAVLAAAAATWPPARHWQEGPFLFRDGQGGGKRVSAASVLETPGQVDILHAEATMRAAGDVPLFLIDQGHCSASLDAMLEARSYEVIDPVEVLAAPLPLQGSVIAGIACEARWPATAAMQRLWQSSGIGSARRAVMARAEHPKTVIAARGCGRVLAVAFMACHQSVAVLHALEVAASARRQGIGRAVMLAASDWAMQQGAQHIAVLVTKVNAPARALYASLALLPVADYHYRQLQP